MSCWEANRKSHKLFPFVKMAEKHEGVPINFFKWTFIKDKIKLRTHFLSEILGNLTDNYEIVKIGTSHYSTEG